MTDSEADSLMYGSMPEPCSAGESDAQSRRYCPTIGQSKVARPE
jgi:hypothetical protein